MKELFLNDVLIISDSTDSFLIRYMLNIYNYVQK